MRGKWTSYLAGMVLVALVVAGCGGSSNPTPEPPAPTATPVPPTASTAATTEAAAAESPSEAPRGDASKGETAFMTACAACHGPTADGVQGLGKSLHASESEFVQTHSDEELVEFIKVGRQPDDPLNTTGIAMPPKGANPALSDDDLYNIVAWIRTLE
jgi:mono/diheme cytochrome c family protein